MLPQLLQGQIVDKGKMYIGIIGSWDNSDFLGLSGTIFPRFEYLIRNKLSVGSDIGYSREWAYKSIKVSPFVKYYFLNKKFSPTAELKYYHEFRILTFTI